MRRVVFGIAVLAILAVGPGGTGRGDAGSDGTGFGIGILRQDTSAVAPADGGETEPAVASLEWSGFFDIRAERLKESEQIFNVGYYELDMERSLGSHASVTTALVFEDGEAEMGVGFVDLHLFRPDTHTHGAHGSLFGTPGVHLQIGQFDVPFGRDYRYYATPERLTISEPFMTALLLGGFWTMPGCQVIRAGLATDVTAYVVNGFDTGYTAGGRIGFRPFANPLLAHTFRDEPLLEIGLSGAYDADRHNVAESRLGDIDLAANLGPAHVIAEYAFRDHPAADVDELAWYVLGNLTLPCLEADLYGRYEEYRRNPDGGGPTVEISRLTTGLNRNIYGVLYALLEYQYYPVRDEILRTDYELSEDRHVVVGQLTITF